MLLGCLAVPIIALLACALLAWGIGSIGQGVAAASVGTTLLVQSIIQPILMIAAGAIGVAAGVGAGLIIPAIRRARRRQQALPPGGEQEWERLEGQQPRQLPVPTRALPAPRSLRHVARRRSARVRINLDKF
jgi:hypothetical protein